jgi:antitoxin CptB
MRELDLLLETFLAAGLDSLDDSELDSLERLLEQPDQDILAWLTGEPPPKDAALGDIVAIAQERIDRR